MLVAIDQTAREAVRRRGYSAAESSQFIALLILRHGRDKDGCLCLEYSSPCMHGLQISDSAVALSKFSPVVS